MAVLLAGCSFELTLWDKRIGASVLTKNRGQDVKKGRQLRRSGEQKAVITLLVMSLFIWRIQRYVRIIWFR